MANVISPQGDTLNWTTLASGSAPSAGDNVIFPANGVYKFTTGPASSVNLASIQIGRNAVFSMPGTMTMQINNSGIGLLIDGARFVRLLLSGNTNKVAVTGASVSGNDDAGVQLVGGAHATIAADDGARIAVGSQATLTDLLASDGGVIECEGHASDTIAVGRVAGGGKIVTSRSILAATLGRGEVRLRDAATIANAGSGSVDMLDDRSMLSFESTSAITLDLVRCLKGVIDPTRARAAITFTDLVRTRKSRIIRDWHFGSITYTNTPTDLGVPGIDAFAGLVGV